jgi:hypothetical protein
VVRDNSLGIATRYGLDGSGIESRRGRDFPQPSRPPWGPPSLLYNGYRLIFAGVKRPGRGVDHPLHLDPRLKKEYINNSSPSLGLRGVFYGELCLFLHFTIDTYVCMLCYIPPNQISVHRCLGYMLRHTATCA